MHMLLGVVPLSAFILVMNTTMSYFVLSKQSISVPNNAASCFDLQTDGSDLKVSIEWLRLFW